MEDDERLLEEVYAQACQLKKVCKNLRTLGVRPAFLNHRRITRRELECWLEIERLIEIAEELADLLGVEN